MTNLPTPAQTIAAVAAEAQAAIGQAYIGLSHLAPDERAVGICHLQEAARMFRGCAERLEALVKAE